MDPQKAHYIVATCIVMKNGKYLILKRSEKEKAFPGEWTVPGGKLTQEDYNNRKADTKSGQWYNIFEDLVRREVREEAGLEVGKIKYLTSLCFKRPDGIPTVVVSLYADHLSGDVKVGEDMTEHKWVTLEEAKNYKLIDGIWEELEMMEKLKQGEKVGEWGR